LFSVLIIISFTSHINLKPPPHPRAIRVGVGMSPIPCVHHLPSLKLATPYPLSKGASRGKLLTMRKAKGVPEGGGLY
jgi:hypothetical protein